MAKLFIVYLLSALNFVEAMDSSKKDDLSNAHKPSQKSQEIESESFQMCDQKKDNQPEALYKPLLSGEADEKTFKTFMHLLNIFI